jgi:hypothetical protein
MNASARHCFPKPGNFRCFLFFYWHSGHFGFIFQYCHSMSITFQNWNGRRGSYKSRFCMKVVGASWFRPSVASKWHLITWYHL